MRMRILLGIVLLFGGFQQEASAGLKDTLNDMYSTLTISPQYVDNGRRKIYAGGYARFRTPNQKFNILNVSAPRLSAGCGGVDLYLGSFSFINADQFRAMLRQIASQALGYAFQLAMKSICDGCATVMNSLAQKINKLSSKFSDTCKLAKLGIDKLTSRNAKEKVKNESMLQRAVAGINDTFGSWVEQANQSADGFLGNGSPTEQSNPDDTVTGNLTWKTLENNPQLNNIEIAGLQNVNVKTLILNIAGTVMNIVKTEAGKADVEYTYKPPLISLSDLMSGNSKKAADGSIRQIYDCKSKTDDPQLCDTMGLVDWDFPGITSLVDDVFYGARGTDEGAVDEENSSVSASKPIVTWFMDSHTGADPFTELKPVQVTFMAAAGGGFMPEMMNNVGNRELLIKVVEKYRHLVELRLLSATCSGIGESMKTVVGNLHTSFEEKARNNIEKFIKDCNDVKDKINTERSNVGKMKTIGMQ